MRLFKSAEELELMRRAGAISAEAHCRAMRACRPGLYEYQLQAILEATFRWHGADAPAYGSIVGGGNNAVILHYVNNDQLLRDGDLVLIDAACEYRGYASDITRTFPVNGKFSKAQREIYELVLKSQLAAIEAARPGVPLALVHQTASRVLRRGLVKLGILTPSASRKSANKSAGKATKKSKLALGDFFMHGTSHWLGIDVHDVGSYKTADGTRSDRGKGKQRLLEPGMVITVEPGLYFDRNDKRVPAKYRGIGVRIEDDVVITDAGNEVITTGVPKTVEEIEALMAGRHQSVGSGDEDIWIGER
jgi:Xaa-Pro aminopeptidase